MYEIDEFSWWILPQRDLNLSKDTPAYYMLRYITRR